MFDARCSLFVRSFVVCVCVCSLLFCSCPKTVSHASLDHPCSVLTTHHTIFLIRPLLNSHASLEVCVHCAHIVCCSFSTNAHCSILDIRYLDGHKLDARILDGMCLMMLIPNQPLLGISMTMQIGYRHLLMFVLVSHAHCSIRDIRFHNGFEPFARILDGMCLVMLIPNQPLLEIPMTMQIGYLHFLMLGLTCPLLNTRRSISQWF